MAFSDHLDTLKAAEQRIESLKVSLDYLRCHRELADIEHQMTQPGFWDNAERAQTVVQKKKLCFQVVDPIDRLLRLVEDGMVLVELGQDDAAAVEADLAQVEAQIHDGIERLEFQLMLGGEHDHRNAILTLQPGAGGIDASDWAEMMLRMYVKWAAKHDYEVEETDFQKAEEAGIKNATIVVKGPYAYGRLKAEQGVHRLVRISPFDGQGRRQTSFASVEVVPELDDDLAVDIRKEDLKVDTFRSSGAGGQHVNKTESAIRITHIPTGIVVACQAERSQHKNRDSAMRTLRSKLYQLELAKREAELAKFYGDRGSISWGNQIRSYVLQPYQMCKDLRTDVETSDVQGVLDGDLDPFIEGYLKQRKEEAKR
ncbi:MAG: peptide chain release factor 2 [Planctomycetes bacterium]|nr:peptide chain release factor 2 [Planctomycetota bacterium]